MSSQEAISIREEPVKERILEAAVRLFAEGGYSGNGVRDIAREAQVSLSMVSYHFGGKLGILRAIFADFFTQYHQIVERSVGEESTLEGRVHRLVRETTRFMKNNQSVFRIVTTELPHFLEEAQEFERQYLQMIRRLTDRWFAPEVFGTDLFADGGCPDPTVLHTIVGPALLSMIYSTFLFGRALEKTFCFSRDDEYFEQYEQIVSRLILAGLAEVGAPGVATRAVP